MPLSKENRERLDRIIGENVHSNRAEWFKVEVLKIIDATLNAPAEEPVPVEPNENTA